MRKILLAIPLLLCYNTGYSGQPRMDDVSDGRGGSVQCVRASTANYAGISCNWDRYNNQKRAMNKLKEIKTKTDDTGSKARTYLDGLLKIPFGIYKKEPVLNIMDTIKKRFSLLVEKIKNINGDSSLNIELNSITNVQIKNECEK